MEIDDDFEEIDLNNKTELIASDNEKKKKKRKRKTKSKRKEKPKINTEIKPSKENEEDNDNLIAIGNLILNKKRYKERKEQLENEKKVQFTLNKNSINEYIKKIINNQKLSISKKLGILICANIMNNICDIFKMIYIFKKIREYQKLACLKISAIYKAYSFRKKFKYNYLILKIMKWRNENVSKIIANIKGYIIRKNIKRILEKKEDNYIIYSTLADNKMIYFKIKYDNNFEDNIYFEYCKVLNCFVFYLSNKERNLSKKKISGFFYNERYKKLVDNLYEKNEKGENVINFPKIIEKNNKNIDKYDKIINEYMKNNRYKNRRFYDVEEYEENKRKAKDDDIIMGKKNNSMRLDKLSRSKSYMRLKGVKKNRSILKPSKSYMNLKSEERKIQFGKAKVLEYHLNQKYLSLC
mgnify:FL=1